MKLRLGSRDVTLPYPSLTNNQTRMSRSWASIVRGHSSSTLNPDAREFYPAVAVFHAFCADCGEEAEVCANGCDRPPVFVDKGKRVCGGCFCKAMWRLGSDSMSYPIIQAADKKNDPLFKCRRCASYLKN